MALSKAKAPLAAAAKAAGQSRFDWDQPCSRGHIAQCFVSSGGCCECAADNQRRWCAANPEKKRQLGRNWQEANPEKAKAFVQQYDAANREARREKAQAYRKNSAEAANASTKLWRSKNPVVVLAHGAKRRRGSEQATPSWVDFEALKAIYKLCKHVSAETGIPHEVDHVIPLKHKLVSGLHVPWNLQIIPAKENRQKNNTWVPSW